MKFNAIMIKMKDTLWITFIGIFIFGSCSNGQSDVEVNLIAKKYVERGGSLILACKHNVEQDKLYKVTWLKSSSKIFEYIKSREPPYRNFTVPGADIDFQKSNQNEVTLKINDFDASGMYCCEVSLESPIFTKASNEEQVHVFLPQNLPPTISFSKRQFYIGEKLVANCTTARAKPVPHITWLINGKKVDEIHTRSLHPFGPSSKHKSKSHHERNDFNEHHVDVGGKSSLSSSLSRDEEIDDVEGNHNSHNSQSTSHRSGYSLENHESTDSYYKNNNNNFNNNNNKNRESNYYDNKIYDMHKKHRNGYNNRKNRRHTILNEGTLSHQKSTLQRRQHPLTYSSSQLSIEVSKLHAGANGRLEITCLATIPAQIGIDEEYADYKTHSVKVDIDNTELTTQPPAAGMAALGNRSSSKIISMKFSLQFLTHCLPIFVIIMMIWQ